jgi:hypothetical protein
VPLLYDDLLGSGSAIYFYDLGSAPNLGSNPSIASVTELRRLGNSTITGTNFGASAGQVTVGGVVQPVVSWSATSIVIGPVSRGALRYGTQPVIVRDSSLVSSVAFNTTLLPQTGWQFINLVAPLATTGDRLSATPDLANTDQVAWGNVLPAGTVTVASDASFTADALAGQFDFEVNDGTGWGGFATQTLGSVAVFNGVLPSRPSTLTGSFNVSSTATLDFSGQIAASAATMSGTFLAFTSTAWTGQLLPGLATMQGTFSITGAVTPPPPSGGGGGTTPVVPPINPQSKVAIVNQALIKLGARQIQSFQDQTKAARIASSIFDAIVDQEQSRHYWNFCIWRARLPEALNDQPRGPFRYLYSLPTDWLTTMAVGRALEGLDLSSYTGDPWADWSHEGRFILTNEAAPLALVYVRRVQDPTQWHPLFAQALAGRLAMELADSLTNSVSRWERARVDYREAIAEARRVNAIQDPPRIMPGDSWLESRH